VSVWDFPRPPAVEPEAARVRIEHRGTTVVDTTAALRVLETSHPPVYYVPPSDVLADALRPSRRTSFCEFKGEAAYLDVHVRDEVLPDVAWSYAHPSPGFEAIARHVAFYPAPFDACWVGDERATPQPGGFYGGWVTSRYAGPFKGEPGTSGW
jgi:uncharacterized protein (DUF427 family)